MSNEPEDQEEATETPKLRLYIGEMRRKVLVMAEDEDAAFELLEDQCILQNDYEDEEVRDVEQVLDGAFHATDINIQRPRQSTGWNTKTVKELIDAGLVTLEPED